MADREFDPQRFSRSLYELVVMAAVLRGGRMHGYEIGLEVAKRTGGRFVLQHGTLYPVLHRLEKSGMVKGRWSGDVGARRRKEYSLTAAGRAHLRAETRWSRSIFDSFLTALDEGRDESLRATS